MTPFKLRTGSQPLLISIPHAGTWLPADLGHRLTDRGRSLPDTDWFVDRLYDLPVAARASVLTAHTSRYLIDLNRPADNESLYPGQETTGLCPTTTFAGESLYQPGAEPDAAEIARRIEQYWRPYHACLEAALESIVRAHGRALLLDAHSIASRVPRLFEGVLPDWNFGTHFGRSCRPAIHQRIEQFAEQLSPFSHVVNGRFVGGYITRHYGRPAQRVDAVQLELSQATYLDEATGEWCAPRAAELQRQLNSWLECLLASVKGIS